MKNACSAVSVLRSLLTGQSALKAELYQCTHRPRATQSPTGKIMPVCVHSDRRCTRGPPSWALLHDPCQIIHNLVISSVLSPERNWEILSRFKPYFSILKLHLYLCCSSLMGFIFLKMGEIAGNHSRDFKSVFLHIHFWKKQCTFERCWKP